jgi:UDP-glucose 4-epimerase
MNILVTGGAGFVGTNLIKKLLASGHKVLSIDNYSTGKRSNEQEGALYFDLDIKDIDKIPDGFKFDAVYHLAAKARIQPSFLDPFDYFTVNAANTFKVAMFCARNEIPLIYAGSSSHHSGRFKNPYTFSKDIGEDIIKLYGDHFKLKYSIARFYNVYGPHQLTEGGYTTLIGRWMNEIEKGRKITIYGDGTKRRDFTHVDDIVDALIKITEKQAWFCTFELGRGINYSVNEVKDMFRVTNPVYMADKPGEARFTLSDNSLAKEVLDWNPNINLEDYINDWINEKNNIRTTE